MSRVRLEDVARHAGVSMKTVSNVVHDYEHVSDTMRVRVQQAIDELGYRPNLMGRRLATGRTGMLSLAVPDVGSPYFAELAHVFQVESTRRGYRLLLDQTGGATDRERRVLSADEAGFIDGLIFHPSQLASAELSQNPGEVPLVILGDVPAPITLDQVLIDDVAGADVATRHLISLGRTRIAFLGHDAAVLPTTFTERIAGYRQALERAGLPLDPAIVIPVADPGSREAAVAVARALDEGARFDALVCINDLGAIGALRALQERGLSVPGDVAVTGWGDTRMASDAFPSLTTIAPDLRQLATTALDLLEERISGFTGAGRHRRVDFTLAVRESAPAPAV
jgi:DNA-binding LacI/PurR family transcriptional regulator